MKKNLLSVTSCLYCFIVPLVCALLAILAYKISSPIYQAKASIQFLGQKNISSNKLLINTPKLLITPNEAAYLLRNIANKLKNEPKYSDKHIRLILHKASQYPLVLDVYANTPTSAINFLNDLRAKLNKNDYVLSELAEYKRHLTELNKDYDYLLEQTTSLYNKVSPANKASFLQLIFEIKNSKMILTTELESQKGFVFMLKPSLANDGRKIAPSLSLYIIISQIVATLILLILVGRRIIREHNQNAILA